MELEMSGPAFHDTVPIHSQNVPVQKCEGGQITSARNPKPNGRTAEHPFIDRNGEKCIYAEYCPCRKCGHRGDRIAMLLTLCTNYLYRVAIKQLPSSLAREPVNA